MSKEIYAMHAEMCKVFSNPIRLEILNILRETEYSVQEITRRTNWSQVNISQHLAIMKAKGIVLSRREGKHIRYKLANPRIIKAFDIIREILSQKLNKG